MAEPNKMLEETANYLLNHCFVLGGVEEQRAKYLYVQDHLPRCGPYLRRWAMR